MTLEKYLSNHYSSTSIRGYLNQIKRFKLALGEKSDQSNQVDILDYIGLLRTQNLHPKSLKNNLFSIKVYFNYLVEIGKRENHPCRYLNLKDQIDRQIQVDNLYPKEILEDLYKNYKATNPSDQERNKIIIGLLIYQAMSVLELINLRIKAIDLEKGEIKIRASSSNNGRTLELKSSQIMQIYSYINQRKEQEKSSIFLPNREGKKLWSGSISRIINQGRDKENKLLAMKIRQSIIANLLKQGVDLRVVQEFAGHRRVGSTEAYKQSGLEELKSVIEKLHPLG